MKKFLTILILSISLCACSGTKKTNTDEIIFYVEMTVNNKTLIEINDFSKFYQELVNHNEPNTLSWKFFKSGPNKVIEISRWVNSEAIKNHIRNISKRGALEEGFTSFVDHFVINKISVLGNTTEEVKEMLNNLGVPVIYKPLISGYSK